MITLRASQMDLAIACWESTNTSGVVAIDEPTEITFEGSAGHEMIANYLKGLDVSRQSVAERHGVSLDAVEWMVNRAIWNWNNSRGNDPPLKDAFGEYVVETQCEPREFCGFRLTGKMDVLSVQEPYKILDWKLGQKDGLYIHQMNGYGALKRSLEPRTVTLEFLRLDIRDTRVISKPELRAWVNQVSDQVRNGSGKFSPGNHCGYCPRRFDCPGRAKWLESGARAIIPFVENLPVEVPHDRLPEFSAAIGAIRKGLERAGEYLKDRLKTEGPVDLGNGREFGLREEGAAPEIDTALAWPILSARIPEDRLPACFKVVKSSAENEVAAIAPPRGKGKAKSELNAALEQAGALTRKTKTVAREYQKGE